MTTRGLNVLMGGAPSHVHYSINSAPRNKPTMVSGIRVTVGASYCTYSLSFIVTAVTVESCTESSHGWFYVLCEHTCNHLYTDLHVLHLSLYMKSLYCAKQVIAQTSNPTSVCVVGWVKLGSFKMQTINIRPPLIFDTVGGFETLHALPLSYFSH